MKRRWSVLVELVQQYNWTHGVEVGVLKGETFGELLSKCQSLHMIGIDPLTPQPMNVFADEGQVYRSHDWLKYQQIMQQTCEKYKSRATWLRMLSHQAVDHVADGSQDFVFIDADHSSKHVEQDIRIWTPKLKPSGWLTGHDTHFFTVKVVIDRMCPGWQEHSDHVWTIPKGKVCL